MSTELAPSVQPTPEQQASTPILIARAALNAALLLPDLPVIGQLPGISQIGDAAQFTVSATAKAVSKVPGLQQLDLLPHRNLRSMFVGQMIDTFTWGLVPADGFHRIGQVRRDVGELRRRLMGGAQVDSGSESAEEPYTTIESQDPIEQEARENKPGWIARAAGVFRRNPTSETLSDDDFLSSLYEDQSEVTESKPGVRARIASIFSRKPSEDTDEQAFNYSSDDEPKRTLRERLFGSKPKNDDLDSMYNQDDEPKPRRRFFGRKKVVSEDEY